MRTARFYWQILKTNCKETSMNEIKCVKRIAQSSVCTKQYDQKFNLKILVKRKKTIPVLSGEPDK